MIKNYADAKAEKSVTGSKPILPADGYVAQIVNAKVVDNDFGQRLVIAFDITEGKYKNFFANDYESNPNEDKKWRGVYRLNIPKDDGSEKDGWSKRSFNNLIFALEDSNNNYVWNWDETKLKGKRIGVVYRNKEWEYGGKTGWTTECGTVASVADIKNGTFPKLKDKALGQHTTETAPTFAPLNPVSEPDPDLPF